MNLSVICGIIKNIEKDVKYLGNCKIIFFLISIKVCDKCVKITT